MQDSPRASYWRPCAQFSQPPDLRANDHPIPPTTLPCVAWYPPLVHPRPPTTTTTTTLPSAWLHGSLLFRTGNAFRSHQPNKTPTSCLTFRKSLILVCFCDMKNEMDNQSIGKLHLKFYRGPTYYNWVLTLVFRPSNMMFLGKLYQMKIFKFEYIITTVLH